MAYTLYVHNKEMGNIMHAIDNTESQDNFYSCLNRAYIRLFTMMSHECTVVRQQAFTSPSGSSYGQRLLPPCCRLRWEALSLGRGPTLSPGPGSSASLRWRQRSSGRRRRPLGAPQTAARATLPEGSPFGESWFQPAVYLHMRSG